MIFRMCTSFSYIRIGRLDEHDGDGEDEVDEVSNGGFSKKCILIKVMDALRGRPLNNGRRGEKKLVLQLSPFMISLVE